MSWHDRIGDGTVEFRGITLYLERGSMSPGRRVEVHEYPLRNDPYVEDMGRKAREWQITGYLIGPDYDVERNRLADAFELPGAFEMRHSYYGTHRVVVTEPPQITESTREGGMARVRFTVVRADDTPRYPTAVADTQQVVSNDAQNAFDAILADFEDAFEIVDLAADRVAEIETTIINAVSSVENVIGDISDAISRVIRTPAELGAVIIDAIGNIKDSIDQPGRALSLYDDLFSTGEPSEAAFSAPAVTRQQAEAETAAIALIRRAAAVDAAEAASGWSYDTRQEAEDALEIVHAGLTEQLAGSVPPLPQTAQHLVKLRASAVQDLRRRGTALPELSEYQLKRQMPALVIAQRLYGDARRDAEIIRRNRVRHPGAVPGGETLEVLSE